MYKHIESFKEIKRSFDDTNLSNHNGFKSSKLLFPNVNISPN